MPRYDDTFVHRFLEPWNRHDVDGALALMTDDCVWEVTRGREPRGTLYTGRAGVRSAIVEARSVAPGGLRRNLFTFGKRFDQQAA
jgi:ketosteroid isomerase-like protein